MYNNTGVYKFVLQEVNTTEDDDQRRGIADYYKFFPKTTTVEYDDGVVIDTNEVSEETGRKVWL